MTGPILEFVAALARAVAERLDAQAAALRGDPDSAQAHADAGRSAVVRLIEVGEAAHQEASEAGTSLAEFIQASVIDQLRTERTAVCDHAACEFVTVAKEHGIELV